MALWQANNSRENAARAEFARARAQASEEQALAIKTFLLQYLRAPDRFECIRNPDSMQEWLQRGTQSAEQQLADMPAAQVEVVQAFAISLASYPDSAATLAAIELADALNDRTQDAMRAIRALNIRGQLARAYYLQGNFIRTKELAGDWPRICSEASDASNRAQTDAWDRARR